MSSDKQIIWFESKIVDYLRKSSKHLEISVNWKAQAWFKLTQQKVLKNDVSNHNFVFDENA